jgi:DNA-binding Lrp family transcriptional regulator
MTQEIDGLDRRILKQLQRDCTLSAKELADRCGTTESTAMRRWKRLAQGGVIKQQVAILDGPAVGVPLMMVVLIRMTREGSSNSVPLMRRIAEHPSVMQFFHVTGTIDFVAIIAVSTMADYEEFIAAVLDIDSHLATDTNVVIRPLKLSLALPLGED